MYEIIWSEPAKDDYWQNIDYLYEIWTELVVQNFINAVDRHLDIISNNPKTFALTEYRNVRSVLIVKQIRLFYKITDNNTVELIRFWNNYKNPERLKF